MEKYLNNKVVDKESNAQCVENHEAKWNTKSFSHSTIRWSTYLYPAVIPSKKTSHIPSSGLSDHSCISESVAMGADLITLPTIKTATHNHTSTPEKTV